MIEFTVPGTPSGQPRQRHRIVKANGRTFASNYLPASDPVNAFKATIRLAYREAGGRLLNLDGGEAISVVILAVFPRPSSKTRKTRPKPPRRLTVIMRNESPFIHMQKPCSYRRVTRSLTEEQTRLLTPRQTGQHQGVMEFEECSFVMLEE